MHNNLISYERKSFNNCPICFGSIQNKYSNLRDRFFTTEELFNIDQCINCQMAFLNPMPIGDASLFYPVNYLSSNDNKSSDETKFDLERWYRYDQYNFDFKLFQRSTGLSINKSSSYLDIGCGSGERVSYVKEKGCENTFGLDKFNFVKTNLENGIEIINSDILDFNPKIKFQIVSLAHVLEHLEKPVITLRHIKENILADNGYLFIQVPNYNALERLIFKSNWFCFDAPRHLWHFNTISLQKLLLNLNFKIKGTYTVNAPLHPVSLVPSIFRSLDIQRIWIDRKHGNFYKKVLKILWAGLTIASIPANIFQNILKRGSMLTIIVSNDSEY